MTEVYANVCDRFFIILCLHNLQAYIGAGYPEKNGYLLLLFAVLPKINTRHLKMAHVLFTKAWFK